MSVPTAEGLEAIWLGRLREADVRAKRIERARASEAEALRRVIAQAQAELNQRDATIAVLRAEIETLRQAYATSKENK